MLIAGCSTTCTDIGLQVCVACAQRVQYACVYCRAPVKLCVPSRLNALHLQMFMAGKLPQSAKDVKNKAASIGLKQVGGEDSR